MVLAHRALTLLQEAFQGAYCWSGISSEKSGLSQAVFGGKYVRIVDSQDSLLRAEQILKFRNGPNWVAGLYSPPGNRMACR
jgi:hypothetical protein